MDARRRSTLTAFLKSGVLGRAALPHAAGGSACEPATSRFTPQALASPATPCWNRWPSATTDARRRKPWTASMGCGRPGKPCDAVLEQVAECHDRCETEKA